MIYIIITSIITGNLSDNVILIFNVAEDVTYFVVIIYDQKLIKVAIIQ